MATRPYEQRARAEEAERTRMRIIEAVFTHLREAPGRSDWIDRIARTAGVARSTVYAIFGSRSGLFDAVGRELAARSGYARLIEAKHQPDARDHLRAGFRAASEMLASNQGVLRAGVSAEDAEHVLWVPTSFESFDSLYTGRGMSTDGAVELLIDIAERALYARPRRRGFV